MSCPFINGFWFFFLNLTATKEMTWDTVIKFPYECKYSVSKLMNSKMIMIKFIWLIIGGLLTFSLTAQESIRVQELMTTSEFEATGLDSLTTEELEALNEWLSKNGALVVESAEISRVKTENTSEQQPEAIVSAPQTRAYGEREPDVYSQITGEFSGWDGKTIFRLANGQIYQQRRPGRWKTQLLDPDVRVFRGFVGYELEVDGHSIGVKRLR